MASGAILSGLLHAEAWVNERYNSPRRKVFKQFPNAGLTLTGVLSMIDSEVTSDPQFTIYEERYYDLQTQTKQANAAGPFTDESNSDQTSGGFTTTAGQTIRIHVDSTQHFRVGMNIGVFDTTLASGAKVRHVARIVEIVDSTKMDVVTDVAWASTLNTTANNDLYLEYIGTAYKEGSDTIEPSKFVEPIESYNYTQIHQTLFKVTGTAAVTELKYDKSGPYKTLWEKNALDHMRGLEDLFIWGKREKYHNGDEVVRKTGGIVWFLEQWEAANSIYRGGSGAAAITDMEDPLKRIIDMGTLNGGEITESIWDSLMEQVFRTTMDKNNEKMLICGTGFLSRMNGLFKAKSIIMQDRPRKDTYGMKVTTVVTPFGEVHFHSHPRFSHNPRTNNSALIVDFGHLKYRHMKNRDTKFLDNVQTKKADYREDMFRTEAGLECMFPESMMLIKNVTSFSP